MFKPNTNVIEEIKDEVHRVVSSVLTDFFDKMIQSISIEGPPRSEPGEPPHVDSRDLLLSWSLEDDPGSLEWQITSTEVYSIYLEFGTDRMWPRPFLFKAIFRTKSEFDKLAADKRVVTLPKYGKDVNL